MTDLSDIVNRGLQKIGTRTTVTLAELAANSSNEAIQANVCLQPKLEEALRMAPWNCATNFANLTLITAAPGTPENTTSGTTLWAKGQPPPPWAYEYQYPLDCLKPLWVLPQFQTGFAGGIPITTAVTGGAASFWQGPPVKYKVAIDQFFTLTGATINNAGTGYVPFELITLASGPSTSPPIGAPAQILVLTVGGGGAIATFAIVNTVINASPTAGGSYFAPQTTPIAQGSTSGVGTGAVFNVTFSSLASDQRVILTNQEFATLCYVKSISDPNVMDPLLLDAWSAIVAANITMALTGDKGLANFGVALANKAIEEARKADGNEGLTINDVTPDWIRVRGIGYSDYSYTPNIAYDWGAFWTPF